MRYAYVEFGSDEDSCSGSPIPPKKSKGKQSAKDTKEIGWK